MKLFKRKDPLNFIEANAILHKIGDQKPYFSLTGRIVINGRTDISGAIHEEILKYFPQLEDFVSLHLSDIDGKPLHSLENGKYMLNYHVDRPVNILSLENLPEPMEFIAIALSDLNAE